MFGNPDELVSNCKQTQSLKGCARLGRRLGENENNVMRTTLCCRKYAYNELFRTLVPTSKGCNILQFKLCVVSVYLMFIHINSLFIIKLSKLRHNAYAMQHP